MSKTLRFVLLAAILTIAFLPLPVRATFNTVCYLSSGTLPPIQFEPDGQGGVTLVVETPNGEGRFMQIRPAGGHWEISSMHTLPAGNALELDSDGFPIVHPLY
jgi:hypothetical protein